MVSGLFVISSTNRFDVVRRRIAWVAAPVGFAAILLMPLPEVCLRVAHKLLGAAGSAETAQAVAASARSVMAVSWLMVVLWLTELIPLAATALLPAILFPVLGVVGVAGGKPVTFDIRTSLVPYAHPVIFLFVGSFLLAGAMRKWGLDRRLALTLLGHPRIARSTRLTLLTVMGVTALASMWISNTATTAMMLPIVTRICSRAGFAPGKSSFGTALLLGVAWSATIGGLATPVGTPPNGITLSLLETAGHGSFTFAEWMAVGVPVSLVLLVVAFFVLLWRQRPEADSIEGGVEAVRAERSKLGPWTRAEVVTAAVFILAVTGWLAASLVPAITGGPKPAGLHEAIVAMSAALLLFLVPAGKHDPRYVLEARDFSFIEWPTLMLFGGGLALSQGIFRTGLAEVAGVSFLEVLGSPAPWLVLFALVVLITFLSEMASNTAISSMMVPVVLAVAPRIGADPKTAAMTVGLASSFAFMLPIATAPNAIAYGSGFVSIRQMAMNGLWMNLISCPVGTGMIYFSGVVVFGTLG